MEQENMIFSEEEAIVEAVLFTMGKAVELRQLAAALGRDVQAAREAVERLKKRYDEEKRGMQITQLEDSWQMCTRREYYENLIRVAAAPKKQVLTDVVLETLSIIAYKQPVTKLEIEKIRGVKSDHAVNRLIEYNLVYEVGRLDAPGRPALFATTEEFLRRFGVGSTKELPEPEPGRLDEFRLEVEEELKLDGEGLSGEGSSGEDLDGENLSGEGSGGESLSGKGLDGEGLSGEDPNGAEMAEGSPDGEVRA